MQNGRADIKYKKGSTEALDLGNDYKASATDCLKKCASKFGIASDIYGREEFKEIGKPVDQVAQPEIEVLPAKNNILIGLFEQAREYGAETGMESIFIQEALERNIDWQNIDDRGVAMLKTQLMSKLTPRR